MQGASAGEVAALVAFLVFAAAIGWFRQALDRALAELPPELRDYLRLESQGGSPRRRRRALADRLTIYGLPAWVPLSAEGRAALARLRELMGGFLGLLAVGPALLTGSAWGLLAILPVLAVLGVRALVIGPWPKPPEGRLVSREGPAGRTAAR